MSCEPTSPEENSSGRQLQLSSCQLEADTTLHADRSPCEPDTNSLNIGDLPDELMLKIFSYMSFDENINILQNVCTCWRLLAQHPALWHDKKYVISLQSTEEEAIKIIRAVPHLRTAKVQSEVSPRVFEALSERCHDLTTLDADCEQLLSYAEAKNLFDGCSKIRTLRISKRSLEEDGRFVDAVAQLSHLRVLQLTLTGGYSHCQIELRALADNCPYLSELDLGWLYYKIQDIKYFIDAQKHVLKHLVVKWTSVEGRCIVPLLTVCANTLQYLRLNDYDVSDDEAAEAFTALGELHKLRVLVIRGVRRPIQDVFVLAFRSGALSKLQELHLVGFSHVMDDILHTISQKCLELRELSMAYCGEHTDAAFEPLWKLKKLEILKISCDDFCGDEIRHIARLPALRELHLDYVKLKKMASGIEYILDMSGLHCLYLTGIYCWRIPFDRFPGKLTNLRKLIFDYCDGDQSVIDAMSAQMPELEIEGDVGESLTDDDDDDDDSDDDDDYYYESE